jgi:hypothetical protein
MPCDGTPKNEMFPQKLTFPEAFFTGAANFLETFWGIEAYINRYRKPLSM